jgi:hypothetical protein
VVRIPLWFGSHHWFGSHLLGSDPPLVRIPLWFGFRFGWDPALVGIPLWFESHSYHVHHIVVRIKEDAESIAHAALHDPLKATAWDRVKIG